MSVGNHISKEAGEEGTVHSCERPEWRTMDTGTSVIIMYLLGLRMCMMPRTAPRRASAYVRIAHAGRPWSSRTTTVESNMS